MIRVLSQNEQDFALGFAVGFLARALQPGNRDDPRWCATLAVGRDLLAMIHDRKQAEHLLLMFPVFAVEEAPSGGGAT